MGFCTHVCIYIYVICIDLSMHPYIFRSPLISFHLYRRNLLVSLSLSRSVNGLHLCNSFTFSLLLFRFPFFKEFSNEKRYRRSIQEKSDKTLQSSLSSRFPLSFVPTVWRFTAIKNIVIRREMTKVPLKCRDVFGTSLNSIWQPIFGVTRYFMNK